MNLFRRSTIAAVFAVLLQFQLVGQVSQPGDPASVTIKTKLNLPDFITPKTHEFRVEPTNEKEPLFAGYTESVDKEFLQKGQWIHTNKAINIWRVGITVPGAFALNVYFDHLNLERGDQLFIYSPSLTHQIGAFTRENNGRYLSTAFIPGDSLVIEYNTLKQNPTLPFSIHEVGVSTSPIGKSLRDFGDSGDCEVLVNCPEGDDFQDEKRGVARVLVKEGASLFWCSGSLVNNTNRDGTPYFLTAHHCGVNATEDDYSQWLFYFNFESSDCEMPILEPDNQSISGAKLIADGEKTSVGSDFKLLLLQVDIPKNYFPYFNGWDRSENPSQNGVGIHHPDGDLKMISTYANPLVSTNYNDPSPDASGRFWQVYWSETTSGHGVTEGGSSGSPLFNSEGYIVGTLSGGRASCTHLDLPDYYGKFREHWENNGTDSSKQLKPWLDPIGSDLPALRGLDLDTSQIKADFDSYNTHIKVGGNVQFNNKSIGDITDYKWEFTGGDPEFSESAIPPSIYYRKIGEYDVKLTVKSPGKIDSLVIKKYVRVLPNIYPNPSKNGTFTIVFGQSVPEDVEITVYNASGQQVQYTAKLSRENTISVDLKMLPQGIYLIKVNNNGEVQTLKVGNKIIAD